ncbi:unnamed protein product, partial [Ectocarpus sp. 13 AM-2016]
MWAHRRARLSAGATADLTPVSATIRSRAVPASSTPEPQNSRRRKRHASSSLLSTYHEPRPTDGMHEGAPKAETNHEKSGTLYQCNIVHDSTVALESERPTQKVS